MGGGVFLTYADFTMSGSAKISDNTVKTGFQNAGGGGVYMPNSTFTMEGGEISGNTAEGTTFVSGGGVYYGTGSSFYLKGGVIKDNILKYKTYGAGGGVYLIGASFVMSGAAEVTPASGGGISGTPDGTSVITDTRNSIYLGVNGSTGYPVAVYGTLTAGTAGLIDLPSTWAAQKLLRSASSATGGSITDFTSSAPTDKFTLGKFITTSGDYAVADIGGTKQWSEGGTGALEDLGD
jgi:hypothetical protein